MGPARLSPPALGLTEPKVDIRRDANEAEHARVEAELLLEHAGAVGEQRLLDRLPRHSTTTRKLERGEEWRWLHLLPFAGIGKILDEHILGDEGRQVPCPARVREGMDQEHFDSVPKAIRGARWQGHLLDRVVARLVGGRTPGVLKKRGEVRPGVQVTSGQPEMSMPGSRRL